MRCSPPREPYAGVSTSNDRSSAAWWRNVSTLAFQAPNGGNDQSWGWVLVDDASLRATLAELYRKGMADHIGRDRTGETPDTGSHDEKMSASVQYLADNMDASPSSWCLRWPAATGPPPHFNKPVAGARSFPPYGASSWRSGAGGWAARGRRCTSTGKRKQPVPWVSPTASTFRSGSSRWRTRSGRRFIRLTARDRPNASAGTAGRDDVGSRSLSASNAVGPQLGASIRPGPGYER